jgi:hypothetical protein
MTLSTAEREALHDPANLFNGFGQHGAPAVVGEPTQLIADLEDDYSVAVAECDDATICLAIVDTGAAGRLADGSLRQVKYLHLDRPTLLGLAMRLPSPVGEVTATPDA